MSMAIGRQSVKSRTRALWVWGWWGTVSDEAPAADPSTSPSAR